MDAVRLQVEKRGVAAADDPSVGETSDPAREIVLVPDLADDLFEDVLDGYHAVEHAVLVDDQRLRQLAPVDDAEQLLARAIEQREAAVAGVTSRQERVAGRLPLAHGRHPRARRHHLASAPLVECEYPLQQLRVCLVELSLLG